MKGLDIGILIPTITAVFQIIAAYLAYRLIPLTRLRIAWGLVSLAIALLAGYKIFGIFEYFLTPGHTPINLLGELFQLVISVAMMVGLALIKPLFQVSQRAEDIYQLFVQNSNQGLVIYQNGKIVFANPAFAYLTGYNIENLQAMNDSAISLLFHPDDRENIINFLRTSGLDSPSVRREVRILNKRGITFWLETYIHRSMYNHRPAYQMTFVNITDRKRIEQSLAENELRHRVISQLTSDYIYSAVVGHDNSIKTQWVSGAFERITGYTFEELTDQGFQWDTLGHPDDKLKAVEAYTFALSNQPVVIEYRILTKHGEVIWLRDYLQPIWNDEEKRVTHIMGAIQDITTRKIAESALKESEARWRSLAENAPIIIITVDPQHRIIWMNRPILQPLGAVIGKDFHILLPTNVRGKFHRSLRAVFADGLPQRLELVLPGSDEQPICYEVIIGPIRQDDEVTSAILVLTDITERKSAEEQLKYLSNHDVLTGLFNRAFFETELYRLQNSRLYPVTIVMTDVNNLKEANDLYGHAAGDELLRTIANVMRESFRSEDIVARIGGDEFAILLPQTDEIATRTILKRLAGRLDAINAQPRDCPLSLSIGAATGQVDANLLDVMKLADNLMYEDKARQKGYASLRRETNGENRI